jgi:hypothetical protein
VSAGIAVTWSACSGLAIFGSVVAGMALSVAIEATRPPPAFETG